MNTVIVILFLFMLSIMFVRNVSLHLQYACKVSTGCKEFLCAFRKFSLFSRMSRVRYTVGSQAVSLVSFLFYSMPVCYSASFLKGESVVICLEWFLSAVKGESAEKRLEVYFLSAEWEHAEGCLERYPLGANDSTESFVLLYATFGIDGKFTSNFWGYQGILTTSKWRV